MKNPQKQFLDNEILNNVISASFRRANIYKTEIDSKEKNDFRIYIKFLLKDFSRKYLTNQISSEEHIEIISALERKISEKISVSFGVAQKLMNLYLKYLWCIGELKSIPPHCPVDSIILSKVRLGDIRWTRMSKDDYKIAIKNISNYAINNGFTNVSTWELDTFNKLNQSYVGITKVD